MANVTFTPGTQIIRDIYSTASDALQAAQTLGCNGYRTYNINGATVYVPCSSYLQYENALRWNVVQGVIGSYGSQSFGEQLVGYQFANAKDEIQGDPFFTLGNFSVNLPSSTTVNTTLGTTITNDSITSYTVQDIANRNLTYFSGQPYVQALQNLVNQNITVDVLFDNTKLDKYVLFSSLQERMRVSLLEIFNGFPAAIKVRPVTISNPSISNYSVFRNGLQAQFKINLSSLSNPFNVPYIASGATLQSLSVTYTTTGATVVSTDIIAPYRNFSKNYNDFVIYYNGIEYPITSVVLPNSPLDNINGLQITVQGDPFSSIVNINGQANLSFYIKPSADIFGNFYSNLSDLSAFLLNIDQNTGKYTSQFTYPDITDNGTVINEKMTVHFPMYDDVNIDMFSFKFNNFTTTLNNLSASYDDVKTNLIARFLTTDSLQEFDTEDRKVWLIYQLYGRQFDEINKYINGISYMTRVSYDKIENVPDLLIKNFAHMLGLDTYEIEDENTLINSLFTTNIATGSTSMTPAEVDIELWRRMVINAFYLFKSKGTRKSVEFILKLVGFPDELFDLNEYVYVADKPVNVVNTLNNIYQQSNDNPLTLLSLQPFDSDGYPTVPINVSFQQNGFSPLPGNVNTGNFDFGQLYVNQYKSNGNVKLFELERTLDNFKSWVIVTGETQLIFDDLNGYTDYYSYDSRLTINSKEFEAYLASNRVLDVSIYRQYARNIGYVNSDLSFVNNLSFDVNDLTFNQFLVKSINNFINPTNRKTISTYPTLTKVYYDYIALTNNPMTPIRSMDFMGNFDTQWVKLIQQFVPFTTIMNAGNKAQNSSFNDNKFKYKHGLNKSVNWLGTDGSEFQQLALRPVYEGLTGLNGNLGNISESIGGFADSFIISGKQGANLIGIDEGDNHYFGVYYTMTDYCESQFYNWESGVDYGNDMTYGGNINSPSYLTIPRNGVFVIYDNGLYRLNTRVLFSGLVSLHTTGLTTSLPPNTATLTYGGITKKIWDYIPTDVNTRTIMFKDSSYETITTIEREFYIHTISIALANIEIGIDYDCPIPQPHVCYYNFSGSSVNMWAYTGTTFRSYTDNTGVSLYVKQPKYFGYSKNLNQVRPNETALGYRGNWTTQYQKIFNWGNNEIYYKGEIVASVSALDKSKLTPSTNMYIVTGATVTGTTSIPVSGAPGLKLLSGVNSYGHPTATTGITGGMYQRYENRTTTDPFMQVENSYIQYVNITNPNTSTLSIDLTKSINLVHIFSGATPGTTYRVLDNIINDQLYLTDSIGLYMDGIYPINPENIGPFYIPNNTSTFLHTLDQSLALTVNGNNYVTIQSLNSNFNTTADDISLIQSSPNYYLVKKNCYLVFNIQLYFESVYNSSQRVNVSLVNSNNYIYNEQMFTFYGGDIGDNRQFTFNYQGFFNAGDKLYINLVPLDVPCTLMRYETINYANVDPVLSEYNQLMDPRFRLLFNSGFLSNAYALQSEGLSIKPIYNSNQLSVDNFTFGRGGDRYNTLPIIQSNYSLDPSYLFNIMYLNYYNKYNNPGLTYDTTSYDLLLGSDKIDFSFTIRSKNTTLSTTTTTTIINGFSFEPSVIADYVEYNFNYTDYYLGNTSVISEVNNPNNAISIGKNVRRRNQNYNRGISYYPNQTFFGGVAIGTGTTVTTTDFNSYDDGLDDFTELNYSGNILTELETKNRYYYGIFYTTGPTAFNYYRKENQVYNTEIYQDILNSVPEFNEQISNYELNDVVKYLITLPVVVETITGTTVVIKDMYRLFVCINDINTNHCYIDSLGNIGQIHEIYRPMGARSCFIEIEKYNPANFTPWGYEETMINGIPSSNVIDYVNKGIIQFDPTVPLNYNFGDVVLTNYGGYNEYFRYIYQKPVTFSLANSYQAGDFVMSGNTSSGYNFYFAKTNLSTGTAFSSTNWTKLTNYLFSHRSISSNAIGTSGVTVPPTILSWLFIDSEDALNYSSTAARFPKTLPITTGGTPMITNTSTYGGISYGTRWTNVLLPNSIFIDTCYSNLDNYEIINQNKIVKSHTGYTGTPDIYHYSGSTTGLSEISYLQNYNYIDNFGISRNGVTNIYLKPGIPTNAIRTRGGYETNSIFLRPINGDSYGLLPLFERLGRETERNNPQLWITTSGNTIAYSNTANYLGYKYAVNRGVLYEYINPVTAIPSGLTIEPCFDTTNWTESDFCLVNNFTYYKDRTRVNVYESAIQSLTTGATNELYFFNPNFTLKNGFTNTSFTGATIDQQLITALNKFYDVTDTNRKSPVAHGQFNFDVSGQDIIMNYTYEKDPVGYPLTGEFIGKLNIVNPCGQSATTYFGFVFDTNINALNRTAQLGVTPIVAQQSIVTFPYVIRVIINQSSNANVTVTVTTSDTNSLPIVDTNVVNKYTKFDKKYNVIPNTDIIVTVTYSTAQSQTTFNSARVDNLPIFVNDVINNTNFLQTSITNNSLVETRTVTLLNVSKNSVINVNLSGVETITTNVLNAQATFNVKNIKISTAQL